MKKILLFFYMFLVGCGYQSIYSTNDMINLNFKNIKLEGNKEINRKIINTLSIKEDENILQNNELILRSILKEDEALKNSKGQVISYKSRVFVELTINKDGKVFKNKSFSQEFTYNNQDNKFDLVEYQNEVIVNITNKIIEEIIIYLNL